MSEKREKAKSEGKKRVKENIIQKEKSHNISAPFPVIQDILRLLLRPDNKYVGCVYGEFPFLHKRWFFKAEAIPREDKEFICIEIHEIQNKDQEAPNCLQGGKRKHRMSKPTKEEIE